MKLNQIKLLLKRDEGLAARLHKQHFDQQRAAATLMTAAVRYDLRIEEKGAEGQEGPTQRRMAQRWHGNEDLEVVGDCRRKQSQDCQEAAKGRAGGDKAPKAPKLELKEGSWSVPMMKQFALGQASDEMMATKHSQQLCGSSHVVALVTVKPLLLHRHQHHCVFVVVETNDKKESKRQFVNGCVNSHGPQPVVYLAETQPIMC